MKYLDLRRYQIFERKDGSLQKLPSTFYSDLVVFFETIGEHDRGNVDLLTYNRNCRMLAEEVCERRFNKIVQFAMVYRRDNSVEEPVNMLEEEKVFYYDLTSLFKNSLQLQL